MIAPKWQARGQRPLMCDVRMVAKKEVKNAVRMSPTLPSMYDESDKTQSAPAMTPIRPETRPSSRLPLKKSGATVQEEMG